MLKDRDAMGPVARAASPCPSGGESATCPAACAGCGGRILDRYYLLAVDRQWHSPCLKCCECKLPLDTELTCFARDGNIYCKEDYYRWVILNVLPIWILRLCLHQSFYFFDFFLVSGYVSALPTALLQSFCSLLCSYFDLFPLLYFLFSFDQNFRF